MSFRSRYDNWIGGQWVPPVKGEYFENVTPVTGQVFTEVARGTEEDIELALDAAHAAAPAWGKTSPAERAVILNKIADRIEENLESIALAESWDNGKPIRETLNADIPLAIDTSATSREPFARRRVRSPRSTPRRSPTTSTSRSASSARSSVELPDPHGRVEARAGLAAGNAVVLKPAEQTPASILHLISIIGDLLPPGVVNIVNGFGVEAGKPLASSPRIRKIAFTGETTTGRLIMQYASQNLIPVTLELGGKSPNIFFSDVLSANDDYQDKALEGFTMFALNQGEVCTCPSRALIQQDIFDDFLSLAAVRTKPSARAIRSTPTR